MAFALSSFLLQNTLIKPVAVTFCRYYAVKAAGSSSLMGLGKGKKKEGGKAGVAEKIKLPVETDVSKLVNYVCGSNIYVTGEDIKLKPDNEYPEWLWELRTGPAPKLHEMDPNSKKYWLKVRAEGRRRIHVLKKAMRKF